MRHVFGILLVMGFFFGCNEQFDHSISGENTVVSNDELIDSLIGNAVSESAIGNHAVAAQIFDEIEDLFNAKTDPSLKLLWFNNKTELIKLKGDYVTAINNYYKVEEYSQVLNDSLGLGLAYYNLGTVFYAMDQLDKAESYINKASLVFYDIGDTNKQMYTTILYSGVCRKTGAYEKAKLKLEKAINYYEKSESLGLLSLCFNNYGNILFDEGKFAEALEFYQASLVYARRTGNEYGMALKMGNVGETYLALNQPKTGLIYIDSSLSIARELDAKETIKHNLIRLTEYYGESSPERAVAYWPELYDLNSELLKLESEEIIEKIEKNNEIERALIVSENEIKLLQSDQLISDKEAENRRLISIFIISIIAFITLIIFILYKRQKKIRVYEKLHHQNEKKLIEAEKAKTENELKNKVLEENLVRNELVFFSVKMGEFLSQIEGLKEQFKAIDKTDLSELSSYQKLRKNHLSINQNLTDEIHARIDELSSAFYFNLKMTHPDLTEGEYRIATLLVAGMSSKEIANILVIEPKSVDMKRYRLRKKLNLDPNDNLIDALKLLGGLM